MKINKLLSKLLLTTVIIFILTVGGFYWAARDNLHSVIPNQAYRSAQLSTSQLSNFIKQKDIYTIINLRGDWQSNAWYRQEVKLAKKLHVTHYDLNLPTHRLPSKKDLTTLVHLIETSKRPLLVHCKGGADRTGLASAIILILNNNQSLPDITSQYSLKYFVTSSDSVGKLVIPLYLKWLKKNHLKTNKQHFMTWLHQLKPGVNYPILNSKQ